MLKIENTEVVGWEHAIRGMRNPKNSWDRSDSVFSKSNHDGTFSWFDICENGLAPCAGVQLGVLHEDNVTGLLYEIGPNDHKLMMQLASGGPVHAKYRRMITVYMDVTAPLYWWKEFDTYKVGTVANSCSTMHKIHDKEFTLDNFSCEHLFINDLFNITINESTKYNVSSHTILQMICGVLNTSRQAFLDEKDPDVKKMYWWQMIQLLPSSYNQKRTIMLNYEVLHNIYISRKDHKLDEWHVFCDWIENLPHSEIITGKKVEV